MSVSGFESLSGETDVDFPEYDAPPAEPMGIAQDWVAEAKARGVREPLSMALATADEHGRASNRIVTITELTGRGLVFTTHSGSRKGRELAANTWASGLLYWRESGRQLCLSGPVTALSGPESNVLWNARAVPLHAMSSASQQSDPLDDPPVLRAAAGRLGSSGAGLPRPARFTGYRLEPASVEFWSARSDRLHYRLRYELEGPRWRFRRLQP